MIDYFKSVWAWFHTILIGMKITFTHLFSKKVTIQYPNERYPIPHNAKNRLQLYPDLCNGCMQCARVCPVQCIDVETIRVVPTDPDKPVMGDGTQRKLWVSVYDIDFAKCCFCGLCTTVCPTEAIKHTTDFEYSSYTREGLIYHFSAMSSEQVEQKKKLFEEWSAKEKAAKAGKVAEPSSVEKGEN
ncbi:MAG: NADH-quinone oxidoreductase subunit I [Ignavibacteria bacterium]|nr:NADH-quinone oxidoreductase subunit I [Ignavibacteria bacterium]